MCWALLTVHQHVFSSTKPQNIMNAPSFRTLASHWLYYSADEGQTGCQWQKPCVVQTAGQITDSMSANVTYESNLHGDGKKTPKQLDASELNKTTRDKILSVIFAKRLDAMQLTSEDLEENWTVLRNAVHSSAIDTLGHTSCKHQDWLKANNESWRKHR